MVSAAYNNGCQACSFLHFFWNAVQMLKWPRFLHALWSFELPLGKIYLLHLSWFPSHWLHRPFAFKWSKQERIFEWVNFTFTVIYFNLQNASQTISRLESCRKEETGWVWKRQAGRLEQEGNVCVCVCVCRRGWGIGVCVLGQAYVHCV